MAQVASLGLFCVISLRDRRFITETAQENRDSRGNSIPCNQQILNDLQHLYADSLAEGVLYRLRPATLVEICREGERAGKQFRKNWGNPPIKENMRMRKHLMILAAMAMTLSTVQAFAATQATNTNTISPTLVVNVTVQKAVRLTLATGTTCTVNAGGSGDYNINLGNVDALAIQAPACGNSFAPTTPGTTNAAYYSDYTITPIFTSQSVSTNTIDAYVSSNFAKANLTVVQANALPASIAGLTAMSTSVAAQTSVATNALSGTALTRYVGVEIAPSNGPGLTGADAATITYTLTVQ